MYYGKHPWAYTRHASGNYILIVQLILHDVVLVACKEPSTSFAHTFHVTLQILKGESIPSSSQLEAHHSCVSDMSDDLVRWQFRCAVVSTAVEWGLHLALFGHLGLGWRLWRRAKNGASGRSLKSADITRLDGASYCCKAFQTLMVPVESTVVKVAAAAATAGGSCTSITATTTTTGNLLSSVTT